MSENILIALISASIPAAASVIGIILSNRSRKKDDEKRDAKKAEAQAKKETLSDANRAAFEQKVEDKLLSLEEKLEENAARLDKHNGYGEKWAESNALLGRMEERLKNIEEETKENKEEHKQFRDIIRRYHGGG